MRTKEEREKLAKEWDDLVDAAFALDEEADAGTGAPSKSVAKRLAIQGKPKS